MTERKTAVGEYGRAIGTANKERVRAWMATHIGGTNRECAEALGLSVCAVGRHVKALRAEWSQVPSEALLLATGKAA